jgi:hypothetical protein
MKTKKIYCLNTILEHNDGYEIEDLEAWFSTKPTTKNLMDYFELEANHQKSVNKISKLLAGESVLIEFLMYRLEPMDECTFKE